MAACFLLSVVSVHELNGVCAEVRAAASRGRGGESVPDHLREPSGEGSVVSAGIDRLEVEADPADHVVRGVRPLPGQGVADGEEELGADAQKLGVGGSTWSEVRAFGTVLFGTETSVVARSGALSAAYWFARPGAFPGLSGSA